MELSFCVCDVCGTEKREANHWFVVTAIIEIEFKIQPWEEAQGSLAGHEHICGQECLHKRLSQWLEINSRTASAT